MEDGGMKSTRPVKVIVKQDEEAPIEKSVLATHILEISRAMKKLMNAGINRDAVILLTFDRCKPAGHGFRRVKPSKATIRAVFNALADLEREYCRRSTP
jgi:hypothetical protein